MELKRDRTFRRRRRRAIAQSNGDPARLAELCRAWLPEGEPLYTTKELIEMTLRMGPRLPAIIAAREREVETKARNFGIDYSRDSVQGGGGTDEGQRVVEAKEEDWYLAELRLSLARYERIMSALTTRQREYVELRYGRGLSWEATKEAMVVENPPLVRLNQRVWNRCFCILAEKGYLIATKNVV